MKVALRAPSLLAALLLLSTSAAAAKEYLFVHNTRSGEISKISIPEHEVVDSFEIGLYMDYLAPSPDGKVLYVNRIDSLAPEQGLNIGETGELIALDPVGGAVLWRLPLDGMPHHMSVSKDGRYVFVPYYDTWWLAVVDTRSRQVVEKVFLGHGSHGTKLSPDGKRLYVGSMMNDTISIVNTETFEREDRIPFDDGVRPFALTADEETLYVQLSRHHSFEVVDVDARRPVRRVQMPELPDNIQIPDFYPHNVNHGIALTPDERFLLANGSIADYVVLYSHPELELQKVIPTGDDPNSISFSGDGRFAYVTNRGSDDLSIIDVAEMREVKRLPLGDYPQRMAVIDIPVDAAPAPKPRVTAVPSARKPADTPPRPATPTPAPPKAQPEATRVAAVSRQAERTAPEIVVMESPMSLELEVGDLASLPEGYAWRTRETEIYEVEQARILEVRVSQERARSKRRVKVALDFFSTKKSQRFDVELALRSGSEAIGTQKAVASAGKRLPEQLNEGRVVEELLFEVSEEQFETLFGGGGSPGLSITVTPR